MSTLQALPEPLRSQMLNGDFRAGMQDDIWQVIPTAWIEAAMARWETRWTQMGGVLPPMDSMGVDVARGGVDSTVLAPRYGNFYGKLVKLKGSQTPDGHAVAGQVVSHLRDHAVIHIDVIGVGASPHDILKTNHQSIGVNVANRSLGTDRSGTLRFLNLRSELWWMLREALDPQSNNGICLPPDSALLADLTAPKWKLQGPIIVVEGREDIVKRIGRSPDDASAVILAQIETPKAPKLRNRVGGVRGGSTSGDYDPIEYAQQR